ncbi:YbaB/EbfC family nucleoid-associated protein [Nocardia aurea]|uniref:YbaB/EbfC family nucleoid-associated protein n=1 Tax=Nocardia aurea TaxID=2144174 RepID=UPI0033A5DD1E
MGEAMDALEARVRGQLDRIRDLGERMAAIRVRETSADAAVTAVVDGNGALCDLELSGAIARMSPAEFEQVVVNTAARAAQRAFAERGELVAAFNYEAAE